jgi:hypothetical protein
MCTSIGCEIQWGQPEFYIPKKGLGSISAYRSLIDRTLECDITWAPYEKPIVAQLLQNISFYSFIWNYLLLLCLTQMWKLHSHALAWEGPSTVYSFAERSSPSIPVCRSDRPSVTYFTALCPVLGPSVDCRTEGTHCYCWGKIPNLMF